MIRYVFTVFLQIWRYIPEQYRNVNWYDFFRALLSPLQTFHSIFYAYAYQSRLNASYIGSTGIVEHILNLKFNGGLSGIFIENVFFQLFIQQRYMFYLSENKPPLYLKYLSETGGVGSYYLSYLSETYTPEYNFIVHIPATLSGTFDELELTAIVNSYIGPDKSFTINYY